MGWTQILPLRYNPHKMCQYSPTSTASLRVSEEGLPAADLAFRLRSLVKAGLVKAAEGVPMHTHDNPPLEVKCSCSLPFFDGFCRLDGVLFTLTFFLTGSSLPWGRVT